uniref:Uncharacterized protein n=1 Tax=Heterosigma akashiwo TaxID=2829 RepID=A0A7S3XJT0_HETAK
MKNKIDNLLDQYDDIGLVFANYNTFLVSLPPGPAPFFNTSLDLIRKYDNKRQKNRQRNAVMTQADSFSLDNMLANRVPSAHVPAALFAAQPKDVAPLFQSPPAAAVPEANQRAAVTHKQNRKRSSKDICPDAPATHSDEPPPQFAFAKKQAPIVFRALQAKLGFGGGPEQDDAARALRADYYGKNKREMNHYLKRWKKEAKKLETSPEYVKCRHCEWYPTPDTHPRLPINNSKGGKQPQFCLKSANSHMFEHMFDATADFLLTEDQLYSELANFEEYYTVGETPSKKWQRMNRTGAAGKKRRVEDCIADNIL